LVPTVLGAWVGVSTGLLNSMGAGLSTILFLAGAFGFMFAIEKNKDSAKGVYLLLAFTFFMGLMMSRLVGQVLGLRNGASLVMTAFLTVGAVIVLVAMVANIFLQSSALMLALLVLCLGIFSAFMLYDIKRVMDGGETNYVSATLAIYLDVYNVFQSLLALLGIFGGEKD